MPQHKERHEARLFGAIATRNLLLERKNEADYEQALQALSKASKAKKEKRAESKAIHTGRMSGAMFTRSNLQKQADQDAVSKASKASKLKKEQSSHSGKMTGAMFTRNVLQDKADQDALNKARKLEFDEAAAHDKRMEAQAKIAQGQVKLASDIQSMDIVKAKASQEKAKASQEDDKARISKVQTDQAVGPEVTPYEPLTGIVGPIPPEKFIGPIQESGEIQATDPLNQALEVAVKTDNPTVSKKMAFLLQQVSRLTEKDPSKDLRMADSLNTAKDIVFGRMDNLKSKSADLEQELNRTIHKRDAARADTSFFGTGGKALLSTLRRIQDLRQRITLTAQEAVALSDLSTHLDESPSRYRQSNTRQLKETLDIIKALKDEKRLVKDRGLATKYRTKAELQADELHDTRQRAALDVLDNSKSLRTARKLEGKLSKGRLALEERKYDDKIYNAYVKSDELKATLVDQTKAEVIKIKKDIQEKFNAYTNGRRSVIAKLGRDPDSDDGTRRLIEGLGANTPDNLKDFYQTVMASVAFNDDPDEPVSEKTDDLIEQYLMTDNGGQLLNRASIFTSSGEIEQSATDLLKTRVDGIKNGLSKIEEVTNEAFLPSITSGDEPIDPQRARDIGLRGRHIEVSDQNIQRFKIAVDRVRKKIEARRAKQSTPKILKAIAKNRARALSRKLIEGSLRDIIK